MSFADTRTLMGVMQFVAVVKGFGRQRFMVLRVGDPKYYMFVQLYPGTLIATGVQFPVEKKRLRREIASALNHGWGNAGADGDLRTMPPGLREFANAEQLTKRQVVVLERMGRAIDGQPPTTAEEWKAFWSVVGCFCGDVSKAKEPTL